MNVLRHILCRFFGYCVADYNSDEDPVVQRFDHIESRVKTLQDQEYWMPSDLLDLR